MFVVCFFCFLMIRRPPRSTRTDTSFPTRRSSDLVGRAGVPEVDPEAVRDAVETVRGVEVVGVAGIGGHDDLARFEHAAEDPEAGAAGGRSEEHTSELQSLMRISYAVFCLKKKKRTGKTQMT